MYRQQPRVLLFFSAASSLILIAGLFLGISKIAIAVLALFVIVGLVVGLGSERLILDFSRKRLQYEDRMAGYLLTCIDDDFSGVEAVAVVQTRTETLSDERRGQSVWHVMLQYARNPKTGMLLGVFSTKEEAMSEAVMLHERMSVPIEDRQNF